MSRKAMHLVLFLGIFWFFVGDQKLRSQSLSANDSAYTVLVIEPGLAPDGSITPAWLQALRYLRDDAEISAAAVVKQPLTAAQVAWADLIGSRLPVWQAMIDSLRIAFGNIAPPDTVVILPGNRGGEDAFVYADATICFDLDRLHKIYGAATSSANSKRIDRFFAHEFTHILHKAWRRQHPVRFVSLRAGAMGMPDRGARQLSLLVGKMADGRW